MDLLKQFRVEVNRASELTEMKPIRECPKEISLEDFDPSFGYRYGVLITKERLSLSSKLHSKLRGVVLRRESFILFLPPVEERIPQILDLAWAYSNPPEDLWRRCYEAPDMAMFKSYDPVRVFSHLSNKRRNEALKTLLIAARAMSDNGTLDFPSFYYLMRKVTASQFRLTPAERRIMEIITQDPYADRKSIERLTGLSQATISRGIEKLRDIGYLSGPKSVDLSKLGLITIVVSLPNKRSLKQAFMSFPFTYRIFEPLSERKRVYAFLVIPVDALKDITYLEESGIEIYQVIGQKFILNPHPSEDVLKTLACSLSGRFLKELSPRAEISRPSKRLDVIDLRILNLAMVTGECRESQLAKAGIPHTRYRLRKLRNEGLLRDHFTFGTPPTGEDLLVGITCSEREFVWLVHSLGKVSSLTGVYVKGSKWNGLLAFLLPESHLKSELLRSLRLLLGDRLMLAEDVIDYLGDWTIPIHLWNEDKQRFNWEEKLEDLRQRVALISGRSEGSSLPSKRI